MTWNGKPAAPKAPPNYPFALTLLAGAAVFVLALFAGQTGNTTFAAITGIAALLSPIAAFVAGEPHRRRHEKELKLWEQRVQRWKEQQTQAWIQARARGELWPCPNCGSRTCTNQHSTTRTSGVKVGWFYGSRSDTDPD